MFYGMPYSGVLPIEPDLSAEEFNWPKDKLAKMTKTPSAILKPAPPVKPPPGVFYPLAQEYSLTRTTAYRAGFVYLSDFRSKDKRQLHDNMLSMQTPPQASPRLVDGYFLADPIPGMVQAVPGLPLANTIDGNLNKIVTVCCVHTLESMDAYEEGKKVREWSKELERYTWGKRGTELDGSEVVPLYAFPLKANIHSGPSSAGYDSSYSLASTKGEGEGMGVGIPAYQMLSDVQKVSCAAVLKLIARIQTVVMSCSLSRFELEMIKFNNEDNNVFSFGNMDCGNTGVQMNVSSGMDALWKLIGQLQGSWHTDINDCLFRFTMFTLLLHLPPGGSSAI